MFNKDKDKEKKIFKFSVGQVVQLKSGGPKMTIAFIYPDAYRPYKCDWFTWNDAFECSDFTEEELIGVLSCSEH